MKALLQTNRKIKLDKKQKRLWELEKFLLKVIALVIPVYLIITFGISLGPVQLEAARESGWVLGAMGFKATLYGAAIVTEFAGKAPFFFTISADCTGWKAMLFFAALLLAVPRRAWRIRVAGLTAGVAAIWLVNLFRVAAVVSAYSSYGLDAAMLVHDYLWQIGMGLAALLLWAAWLKLSGKKPRRR
jgi:exosortase/archaeosortase family protein